MARDCVRDPEVMYLKLLSILQEYSAAEPFNVYFENFKINLPPRILKQIFEEIPNLTIHGQKEVFFSISSKQKQKLTVPL